MIRHIPNLLTVMNLLSGGAGIVFAFRHPEIAPINFILIACVFDFFDGFAARMLGVSSPIGKELDSLADVVSFGVFPAVIMFLEMEKASAGNLAWIGLGLAAFSALRLAKFNVDDRQQDAFIGLPTPAMAMFIASLPIAIESFGLSQFNLWILTGSVILMCIAMVSALPLPALKFRKFGWAGNELKYLLIILAICLIPTLGIGGIAPLILIYLSSSIIATKI